LLGQYGSLRYRALLVLAGAYLFTALMGVAHALTFPGLFSAGGLLGASPQSTAWLYMFWHAAFPLLVIAYVFLSRSGATMVDRSVRPGAAIAVCVAAVIAAGGGFTLLATAGVVLLPHIMAGNRYTPALPVVVTIVWLLSVAALTALWRRRPHSVL